jgi:hypothetical protein
MELELNGVDVDTIMKIGHCTSSTFLVHSFADCRVLNAGLARWMVHPIYFQNIGG